MTEIRVTINLDEADERFNQCYGEATNYSGSGRVNKDGVCVYWYGSPSYWIEFKDVKVIEE